MKELYKVSVFIETKETRQEVGLKCNDGFVFFTSDYDMAYVKMREELTYLENEEQEVLFDGYRVTHMLNMYGKAKSVNIEKFIDGGNGNVRLNWDYQSIAFLEASEITNI